MTFPSSDAIEESGAAVGTLLMKAGWGDTLLRNAGWGIVLFDWLPSIFLLILFLIIGFPALRRLAPRAFPGARSRAARIRASQIRSSAPILSTPHKIGTSSYLCYTTYHQFFLGAASL